MHKLWLCAAAGLALGCGGLEGNPDGGDASLGDGGLLDEFDAGPVDDAGYTACSTPDDYQICFAGDASICPTPRPGCAGCAVVNADDVNICQEVAGAMGPLCGVCADGLACVRDALQNTSYYSFLCAPYTLAHLWAKYAGAANVRYADFGDWTGEPLPLPTTCAPNGQYVQFCGGNCGGCAAGEVCTGRSPLHAYGYCAPAQPLGLCRIDLHQCDADAGAMGCFIYTVQADTQDLANHNGTCLPLAQCQELASMLPGGGTCIAQ